MDSTYPLINSYLMRTFPIYQVDAFSERPFAGNYAAVVLLDDWLSDATMLAIAQENNYPETAFLSPKGPERYALRWFTPAFEVDLCGHATLAAGHVVLRHLYPDWQRVDFETLSGVLTIERAPLNQLAMTLPARPPAPREVDAAIVRALGARPVSLWAARDLMAVFETEAEVAALRPDFRAMLALEGLGVIATARSQRPDCDVVSRFFVPKAHIDEDPVTGSAHSTLVPFWCERLGVDALWAEQISARHGRMRATWQGESIVLEAQAVTYLEGRIFVS